MELRNITPEIKDWLAKIGVTDVKEFNKIGAKKIYLQLLDVGHPMDDELRLRLHGAEHDIDWQIIAEREQRRSSSRFADVDEA